MSIKKEIMNIFDPDIIEAFKDTLLKAEKIAVIGHKNVDADCLGASLAVSRFFDKLGCQSKIIIPDAVPELFGWLDLPDILIYEQAPWDAVSFINDSDVIFMLDFSDFGRINELSDIVEVTKGLKINIDHHREPKEIADFAFVDYNRSSASELVYEFLKIVDEKNIDKEIAEAIFMGIVSDTGSFKYDSANSETFLVAAELLRFDIDKSKIISGLYNNYTFDRLKLLGYSIQNRIIYLPEKSTAFMYLSNEDKQKYNYKEGDQENFVNTPLSIKGILFSALILETEDDIKISLRSIGDFDVNKVARRFFNGGGHKNASGGRSDLPLKETVDFFQQNIDQIIEIATEKKK